MPNDPAQRTAMEIAALTRVLFGVPAPLSLATESVPPSPEPPVLRPQVAETSETPEPSVPVAGIPVPDEIPAPAASAAPVAPASLPLPDIAEVAAIPVPAAEVLPEPAPELPRRPAGPSPELLQEIAFLEE